MPKGVKGSVDYDAQIAKIDEKIEKYTDLIKGYRTQRDELTEKKQSVRMKVLYEYMSENGLSPDEVLEKIKTDP